MNGEKTTQNGQDSMRDAITERAKRERDSLDQAGRKVPSQEQMERTYRDVMVRQERRQKGR